MNRISPKEGLNHERMLVHGKDQPSCGFERVRKKVKRGKKYKGRDGQEILVQGIGEKKM
jgi:hypothetical protein